MSKLAGSTRETYGLMVCLLASAVSVACPPEGDTPADRPDGSATGGAPAAEGTAGMGEAPGGAGGSSPVPVFDEHIYVPSQTDAAIYVYDIGAGASDRPSRVIKGPKTRLANPQSVEVDRFGALYVVNYERDITVFAPGANGDVEPFFTFASGFHPRSISNTLTPTVVGWTASSDSGDTRVYMFNDPYQTQVPAGGLIGDFFASTVRGAWSWSPVAPIGCGAASQIGRCLKVPKPVSGALLCPGTDIDACLGGQDSGGNFNLMGRAVGQPTDAVRFRPDGKLTMAWTGPDTVATYEVTLANPADNYSVLKPSSLVTGPATRLNAPMAVAFDKAGNLYVVSYGRASRMGIVTVYPQDADGDVAPTRALEMIDLPFGLAVGP
jgi:hypothetical protein